MVFKNIYKGGHALQNLPRFGEFVKQLLMWKSYQEKAVKDPHKNAAAIPCDLRSQNTAKISRSTV